MITQPDGSIHYKRRGPPPVPPEGYVSSSDPYVLILKPCVQLEQQDRRVGCCPQTFLYCHQFQEDTTRERCMTCQYRR